MAFVAVEDQQPVFALCPGRYIVIEVLDPIEAYCIGSLAIVGGRDTLVGREVALGVLVLSLIHI